jgi:hypothetical protein
MNKPSQGATIADIPSSAPNSSRQRAAYSPTAAAPFSL